jgi:hypothetical protein
MEHKFNFIIVLKDDTLYKNLVHDIAYVSYYDL